MRRKLGSLYFLAGIALVSVSQARVAYSGPITVEKSVIRQQQRQKYIRVEWLLDQLAIKPDMNIVDIGAGPGLVTFLFAERLKGGKGKVFATDVLPDRVDYIEKEAKKRGFPNVVSVKVRPEGLDPFYLDQRYDLVYLSNAYHVIDAPVEYFTKLRGQLNPGGRLAVVIYRHEPVFTTDDIRNLNELSASIANEPKESPFYAHISARTRSLLKAKGRARAGLAQAIIDDFNALLEVEGFHRRFLQYPPFKHRLSSGDRALADWLMMEMRENATLDLPPEKRDFVAKRALAKLNRIFLVQRWGMFLVDFGQGVYAPFDDPARSTSRVAVIRELDRAGFTLSDEKSLSAYFEALIFTAKAQ